ncbi:DUF5908 family protein [Prolixibacteraceae bacterium Z1-6]|uniref:DUF5908 family protein n=1 Tax=Draconibacterium aestuarii TaxID=2998507 RepID=A0A9X3J517_9BACT|nr:DUF5908 family protein [Prolixibacteraceae bacterium Z1-6]
MPIEIKELHIKIKVGESGDEAPQEISGNQSERDEIIEACVEQVMEILSKKEER